MSKKPIKIKPNRIKTDDLAFSAYLRIKGCPLIKSDRKESKTLFTFDVESDADHLKVDYINSEFVRFYNELRNLKKMITMK